MKLSATKWSHRCEIQRQHACTGADLPIYYTPVTRAIFTRAIVTRAIFTPACDCCVRTL